MKGDFRTSKSSKQWYSLNVALVDACAVCADVEDKLLIEVGACPEQLEEEPLFAPSYKRAHSSLDSVEETQMPNLTSVEWGFICHANPPGAVYRQLDGGTQLNLGLWRDNGNVICGISGDNRPDWLITTAHGPITFVVLAGVLSADLPTIYLQIQIFPVGGPMDPAPGPQYVEFVRLAHANSL